jgi:glucan phosphoethanolaminetransferase (alkaline phosphatase superfamily)
MLDAAIFAAIALLAFGFIFKIVSDEEKRSFLRTLVAAFMVVGLIAVFTLPVLRESNLKQLLSVISIVSFVLAVLFLLGYIKMDQKIRMQRGELHGGFSNAKSKKSK